MPEYQAVQWLNSFHLILTTIPVPRYSSFLSWWIRSFKWTWSACTAVLNCCTTAAEHLGLFVVFVASSVFQMNNKYNSSTILENPWIVFILFFSLGNKKSVCFCMVYGSHKYLIHSLFIHLMHEKKALNVFQRVTSNSVQPTGMNMLSSSAGVLFHFLVTISFDKPILYWQYCIIFLSACKLCWQSHKHKLAGLLSQSNVC